MRATLMVCAAVLLIFTAGLPAVSEVSEWDEETMGPLPRWREGGTPPPDPGQLLIPYAIQLPVPTEAPATGLITSPPEYAPMDGVVYRYSTAAWSAIVTDMVAELTGDPADDEIAYVVVSSGSQQASAQSDFLAAGADLSKVQFIFEPTDSIWMRDYGPHYV